MGKEIKNKKKVTAITDKEVSDLNIRFTIS